jgi:predicted phage tail protein
MMGIMGVLLISFGVSLIITGIVCMLASVRSQSLKRELEQLQQENKESLANLRKFWEDTNRGV